MIFGDDFMILSNTYAQVDLDAILGNYKRICQKAGKPVMAVVKADAYGHGAVAVAKLLAPVCPFFAVSSASEALELRAAGIRQPILILGPSDPALYEILTQKDIRVAICTYEEAQALAKVGGCCHIALDTGMSRVGFQVTQAALVAKAAALPGLRVEGIFSHFAAADETDLTSAKAQAQRYADFVAELEGLGVRIPVKHLDNSAGIMNFGCHCDMVRAGIILYGLYPSDEVDKNLLQLEPAMSWYSRVSLVKPLEKGRRVSYGGTFTAPKDMVVATVPAGYADGYRRSLSNRFYMVIRGQKAPILGRVCMDQTVVDVTDIPGVQAGDPVELMGKNIPVEVIAAAAGSFNYEQVCDLGRRVTRVYVQNGKTVGTVDYLQGE